MFGNDYLLMFGYACLIPEKSKCDKFTLSDIRKKFKIPAKYKQNILLKLIEGENVPITGSDGILLFITILLSFLLQYDSEVSISYGRRWYPIRFTRTLVKKLDPSEKREFAVAIDDPNAKNIGQVYRVSPITVFRLSFNRIYNSSVLFEIPHESVHDRNIIIHLKRFRLPRGDGFFQMLKNHPDKTDVQFVFSN